MYGADCNMSTIVIRSLELLLVSCSPLGAIHILDTVTAVLTMVVSIVSSTGQVDRSALIQCDGVRGSDGEIELGRRKLIYKI